MRYNPIIPYAEAFKSLERKQRIEYLMDNYREIVDLKKSAMKQSDNAVFDYRSIATKALVTSYKDDPASGVIKRTIVGNTYYWMDSHDDVHIDGVFTKSIKDKGASKIYHYHDHVGMLTAKVGTFSNVYEKQVAWKDLGVNVSGITTALFGDSDIKERLNKAIYDQYLNNEIDQHSVGMSYVTMALAINESDDAYKANKREWDNYIDFVANKQDVIQQGYFWAIKEAKLYEISAVVEGSNKITPTIQNIEPLLDTQKPESDKSTQQKKVKSFYNYL